MTENSGATINDQLQRSIVARPIEGQSALTVIDPGPGQRGPWSFLTGIPNPDLDMVGPPPEYLSVAAWAA